MKRTVLALAAIIAAIFAFVSPAGAATTLATVYNSSTQPLPGNFPSVGAEATNFSEFGDAITLAGTQRHLNTVVVTMSSWACQIGAWNTGDCASAPKSTFSQDVTLNIYDSPANASGVVLPGALIETMTATFNIPYRPSANVQKCNASNNALGEWYDKNATDSDPADRCRNGKATNITFNLKAQHLTLPDSVVFGVSYDTTHDGPDPIGESASCFGTASGCPYDSLNIALNDGPAPAVGAQTFPGTVFQNAGAQSDYCDETPLVGVFNLDSPTSQCWTGFVPAIRITAR
jgi:hypothetical protein